MAETTQNYITLSEADHPTRPISLAEVSSYIKSSGLLKALHTLLPGKPVYIHI